MSMSGTLEKGAHHQNLDLSEEVPPHHQYHHHQQLHHQQQQQQQQQQQLAQLGHHHHQHHQHLQHSNSLASTTTAAGMGGGSETPPPPQRVVVVPPPYSAAESGNGGGSDAPLELRGSLDCWACSVLVTAQNLLIAAVNACLAGVVFGSILTPATTMVAFGFLCHSTVRPHGTSRYCSDLLSDGGCVALLVVGFLLVTPLLVLALAAYCRLARHLQLGLCFIPYSRAVYKNLPATQHHGLAPGGGGGCCCCCTGGGGPRGGSASGKGKVWV